MVYHVFDEVAVECENPWDCYAPGKHFLTLEELYDTIVKDEQ